LTTSKRYLTYLGGSGEELGQKILVGNDEKVYVIGRTRSNDLPMNLNAIDSSFNGVADAYIYKLSIINSADYDFDADGKSDMAVYRNGTWHVNQSLWNYKAQPFGLPTDTPVPADYDGDGKTDFAVWRPSDVSGQPDFYVLKSSNNTLQGASWGTTTDVPMPADYDGDSKVDFAVYRTTNGDGDFFVLNQTGTSRHYRFGVSGDKPVVNDYDGDGKADFAVFRPSNGVWYINNSSNDVFQYINWGLGTDKLVPADYDGDGKTDIAVFRESEGMWYINQSSNGQMKYQQWGLSTDKLVPADYDGDGKTDIAVYRDGQWFIWQSSNNSPNYANVFGNATDIPVQTLAVK
jgi:spore coat protein A, manganese oxidase